MHVIWIKPPCSLCNHEYHLVTQVVPPRPRALLEASEEGNLEEVKRLIAARANLNEKYEVCDPCCAIAYQRVFWLWVLNSGNSQSAPDTSFSSLPLPPPSDTQNRCTPLILAVFKGHLEVVKTLVASGADVNAKNMVGDVVMGDMCE